MRSNKHKKERKNNITFTKPFKQDPDRLFGYGYVIFPARISIVLTLTR